MAGTVTFLIHHQQQSSKDETLISLFDLLASFCLFTADQVGDHLIICPIFFPSFSFLLLIGFAPFLSFEVILCLCSEGLVRLLVLLKEVEGQLRRGRDLVKVAAFSSHIFSGLN